MTFGQSISTCFKKYASFKGRASRSEFWYFYLFILLVYAIILTLAATVDPLFFSFFRKIILIHPLNIISLHLKFLFFQIVQKKRKFLLNLQTRKKRTKFMRKL